MTDLLAVMRSKSGFVSLVGASEDQISAAESRLGVVFAQDYRQYLIEFGVASFVEHELTGICASPRLNVVDVTEGERGKCSDALSDWYVIEKLDIDDVSVWQSGTGQVFQMQPSLGPLLIADSLLDYIGR